MSWIDDANSGETMLDRALALWEAGFHIFPLGSPKTPIPPYFIERCGGRPEEAAEKWPKTPLFSWAEFQTRCPTREEVEQWWTRWPDANIAIITGIQIDVVDADTLEAAAWCRKNLTQSPWENHTGRGVQFLYRHGDLDVRNSANAHTKIDTRGVGGYIVAPGSTHANGTVYQLISAYEDAEFVDDLPSLTRSDLTAIGQYVDPQKEGEYHLSIDLTNVPLALDEEGISEGGRNNRATQLAGRYIGDGDDYQTVLAKLDQWNKRNSPPLPQGELERTIRSVLNTHQRNNPDTYIRATPLAISEEDRDDAPIYNIGDLIDNPPKKPEFLWGGATLFKGARMMIVGQPKAGKSRFLAALLAELAKGGTFLGETVTRPLNTLWLNAEIHKAWLRERMWPIIQATAPDVLPTLRRNFRLTGRIRLDITNPLHFEIIRKTLVDLKIEVVAFDPMINFSPADESNNTEVRRMLDCFDALQAETGVTVILVHHGRKGSKQFDSSTFDIIRGASALRGWYDTGIIIMPVDGSPNTVTLAFELRNGEARKSISIQWDESTATYHTIDFGGASGAMPEEETAWHVRTREIAEWLGCPQLRGQWVETADIVEHFTHIFNLSGKQITRYLTTLLPQVEGIQVEVSMGRKPARYRML